MMYTSYAETGEMDLIEDGILNASPAKIDYENYKLEFSGERYSHKIYFEKFQNETEEEMKLRIKKAIDTIYNKSSISEFLVNEGVILTHAPLLDYEDNYVDVIKNRIVKRNEDKTKIHFTTIKRRENLYNKLRSSFYHNNQIKYSIAGHVPIYDDWNIIKIENKFCILTNDEPYSEKIRGKILYANPGKMFNGTRKIFVLFFLFRHQKVIYQ